MGSRDSELVNGNFRDLDVLRNAEGMKAIISQRVSNGTITFLITREFEREGRVDTTGFIPANQIGAYKELVDLVERRIAELLADPKVISTTKRRRVATGK